MEMPLIDAVTPESASVGDTLSIYGSGFSAEEVDIGAAFSACGFSNRHSYRAAVPFDVTSSRMSVIVPDGAFSGQLRLQWSNPVSSPELFGLSPPPVASGTVEFDVIQHAGDVAKIFFSSAGYDFTLGSDDEASTWLLILFDGADPPPSEYFDYYVVSSGPCSGRALGVTQGVAAKGEGTARLKMGGAGDAGPPIRNGRRSRGTMTFPFGFDKKKRTEFLDVFELGSQGVTPGNRVTAPGAAADSAVFDVYADIDGSTIEPASFVSVIADLKYEGEHVLLYVDRQTDGSCITGDEAEELGRSFDTSIYTIDRNAFGSESDIDGDGKISILLSPVINRLTDPGTASTEGYIAGFFLPGDLLPGYINPSCTNGMEIFYTFVPDPMGEYGNVYEKDRALEVIRGVLAHEFLHMIMFNYSILIFGDGVNARYMQETWVGEGLAHIAEDLNDHTESNIARAGLFLADPGGTTLIHGGDALDERGAAFLFFRYLGDRFGEGIFREIVRTKAVGVKNIEIVTGMDFHEVFSDWAATLYLDGTGITADDRFSYSSIDIRSDFPPLGVLSAEGCSAFISGSIKSMGPEYILLEFDPGGLGGFSINSGDHSLMNAVIIRLE